MPDAFREAGQWPIGAKGSWRRHSCLPRRDSSRRAWRLPTSTRLAGGCSSQGIYTEPSSAFVVMANPMHVLLRPKISPSPSAAIQPDRAPGEFDSESYGGDVLAGGVLHPWVRHEPEYFRIAASIENNRKQLRNFRGRVRMPTRKERRPLEKAPRHECRGGRHECLRHESDPKITLSKLVALIAQWPAPRKM